MFVFFSQLWLKRKEYEQNTDSDTKEQLKYNTETESDDDDDDGDDDDAKAFYRKHWPEMDNQTAFTQWLQAKKEKQREKLKSKSNHRGTICY